jgi:hypothetical protein
MTAFSARLRVQMANQGVSAAAASAGTATPDPPSSSMGGREVRPA